MSKDISTLKRKKPVVDQSGNVLLGHLWKLALKNILQPSEQNHAFPPSVVDYDTKLDNSSLFFVHGDCVALGNDGHGCFVFLARTLVFRQPRHTEGAGFSCSLSLPDSPFGFAFLALGESPVDCPRRFLDTSWGRSSSASGILVYFGCLS